MENWAYILLVTLLNVVNFAHSDMVNDTNFEKAFDFFKQKYNKVYRNEKEENAHLTHFVHNMNNVNSLNENDSSTFYTINKYADEDPAYIQEHFALGVLPYDTISNLDDNNFLRSHTPEVQKTKDIINTTLYDLDEADDLWEAYLKKYNKTYKNKLDNTIHYYRFIKTLVDKNRHNFHEHSKNSEESPGIDGNADVVRKPNEFFI